VTGEESTTVGPNWLTAIPDCLLSVNSTVTESLLVTVSSVEDLFSNEIFDESISFHDN
jgi:hypothetical protein